MNQPSNHNPSEVRRLDEVRPPTSLSTVVCPNCGYSLRGLPGEGTCPECGRVYDQSELILYGFGRGGHASPANAKSSRLVWVLVAPVIWGLMLLRQMWVVGGWDYLGCFWVLGLLTTLYALARRWNSNHPGLIQVRLNDRGCVQYDDLAGPSVVREIAGANSWLVPLFAAVCLMVAVRQGFIGMTQFLIWFPLAAIATWLLWIHDRRFRIAMRQVREGAIADLNAVYYRPTSWANVRSFSLVRIKADSHRLKITRGRFVTRDAVDAELRCTEAQALEVDAMMRQWLDCARGGGK
ncbi:MAG: hypothetical protein ACHRHE_14260 [Tepidisphaerales bacterium]